MKRTVVGGEGRSFNGGDWSEGAMENGKRMYVLSPFHFPPPRVPSRFSLSCEVGLSEAGVFFSFSIFMSQRESAYCGNFVSIFFSRLVATLLLTRCCGSGNMD